MKKILKTGGLSVIFMFGAINAPLVLAEETSDSSGANANSSVPVVKCGVNTFQVFEQCGNDGSSFRGAYWQCYDGYEEKQTDNACKSSEAWQEYGKKICAGHCTTFQQPKPIPINIGGSAITPAPYPVNAKPLPPAQTQAQTSQVSGTGIVVVPACFINEKLMREYDRLMVQLQKAEESGDKKTAQEIINKIIILKKEISKNRANCDNRQNLTGQNQIFPSVAGTSGTATQILLPEPIKPTVVGSGQEISSYYRQKFQKITDEDRDVNAQVEALKLLKSDIDGLIGKLLQNKKEISASEIGGLVPEVKILPGEIKARDVSIKTTDNKITVSVGAKSLSIEPKETEVLINDGDISANAKDISIKDNIVSVGNSEVRLAPSEIIKKLQITPVSMELKEENSKAVYALKTDETRKLFGFIPVQIQKSTNADAVNGNVISESRPWWSFLSTQ